METTLTWLLPMLGGLGIGSLLTSVATHILSRRSEMKTRLYQEKRDAYLGLLDALHKAAVEPSEANAKNFALWQTRVQLFGSNYVAKTVQGIIDTNAGPREAKETCFQEMIEGMKRDLSSS